MDTALVVISPLKGFITPNGSIVLTQKFIDGMMLYREFWKGPLIHFCEAASNPSDNLDNVEIQMDQEAFRTRCIDFSTEQLTNVIPAGSVVLTSVGEAYNKISLVCRSIGAACVYVTELNLRTRTQIFESYQRNALHGAWGKIRQVEQEIRQRQAIAMAAGLQCNGLPTFNAYRTLSRSPLLFFDSRIDEEMLATNAQISAKMHRRDTEDKIRLVFSGRINRIKGVDDLPIIASHLREMKIPFEMTICGDGEYLPKLKKDIAARGLANMVKFTDTLDFKTELVPLVTEFADLFICCHRQGDPSCTYLETMACGVPIVGYANDAFSALASFSEVGWTTPMSDTLALAKVITRLHRNPREIDIASCSARSFAGEHTFTDTFRRRIDHMEALANS